MYSYDIDGLRRRGVDRVPASVPGVVRSETMKRSGRGLTADEVDPRLRQTGFRIVGSEAFVQSVRGK